MKNKQNQTRSRLPWSVIGVMTAILFLIFCAMALLPDSTASMPLFGAQAKELTDGWIDDHQNSVTLPTKLAYPKSGQYVLEAVLTDEDIAGGVSIVFSAKYLNAQLFLDGLEIGSCVCRPEGRTNTVGKTYLLAKLPADAAGKTLRIEAQPLLGDSLSYEIGAPGIGDSGRLIYNLICSDLPILATVAATMCFGILLFLFGFQARQAHNNTFMQTGIFAILFALYSFVLTDTVHLFVSNSFFIYILEFGLLAIFPLPLLVLVYHICIPKCKKYMLANICVVFLNFCLQLCLQFFTHYEMRETVLLTHLVLGTSAILLFPVLALSSWKSRERSQLLLSFSPVLLGAIWDLFRFYLPGTYQKAVGFQLGVLLFIFLQSIYLIRSYFENYRSRMESDVYRAMAYTDALTGLQNRAAFENKIVELGENQQNYADLWCICADINNLKQVNDTLGHSAGDALIRGAAQALQSVMCEGCTLYRTGGDEFVMFVLNQPEATIAEGRACLNDKLSGQPDNQSVRLSIALGYARLQSDGRESIAQLISRADALMYEDKRRWKEQQES